MAKKFRIEIAADECKGCYRCLAVCPKKLIARGKELNIQGYFAVTVENPDNCIGCGSCEKRCPFEVPIRENMKAAKAVFGY